MFCRSCGLCSVGFQCRSATIGAPNHLEEARQRIRSRFIKHWLSVALIEAPIADGQPIGGVDLAPDAIRKADIAQGIRNLKLEFEDLDDVNVQQGMPRRDEGAESIGSYFVKNSYNIGWKVGKVHEQVSAAVAQGKFALTMGGDRSIASGSITAVAKHNPDLAVVWVDAHADCNTPQTSESKNYHGMPLAHVLGWFPESIPGFEWCDHHLATCGA